MKALLVTTICFLGISISYAQLSLEEIRNQLVFEEFNKEQTVAFYKKMSSVDTSKPVFLAYQGVSEALMAKVKWDPFSKLAHLADAREMIDHAIELDDNNLEIRFLRFSLEYYVPAIFRIQKNMEVDRQVMLSNLKQLDNYHFDNEMVQYILSFLSDSELCTMDEVAFIESKMSNNEKLVTRSYP